MFTFSLSFIALDLFAVLAVLLNCQQPRHLHWQNRPCLGRLSPQLGLTGLWFGCTLRVFGQNSTHMQQYTNTQMAVALCVPGPLKVKAKSSRNPRLTSKAFFFFMTALLANCTESHMFITTPRGSSIWLFCLFSTHPQSNFSHMHLCVCVCVVCTGSNWLENEDGRLCEQSPVD